MALFENDSKPADPRASRILARSVYRELRAAGFTERDVMAFVGEIIEQVTADVRRSEPSSGQD